MLTGPSNLDAARRSALMGFRYIGSKARVVNAILERIGEPDGGTFFDGFSGTGAVAQAASEAGWRVHVNDHLTSAAMMSFARVTSRVEARFTGTGGYSQAIVELNAAAPVAGFIWREYSPASVRHCTVSRMYFTEQNATENSTASERSIERWRQRWKLSTMQRLAYSHS